MSKFKVGDRVLVYGRAFDGVWCNGYYAEVKTEPDTNGRMKVRAEDKDSIDPYARVHHKQCRRLKPKAKLRGYWIVTRIYGDGDPYVVSRRWESEELEPNWECIYVREVRKK